MVPWKSDPYERLSFYQRFHSNLYVYSLNHNDRVTLTLKAIYEQNEHVRSNVNSQNRPLWLMLNLPPGRSFSDPPLSKPPIGGFCSLSPLPREREPRALITPGGGCC